jgi:hypothetical protein
MVRDPGQARTWKPGRSRPRDWLARKEAVVDAPPECNLNRVSGGPAKAEPWLIYPLVEVDDDADLHGETGAWLSGR